MAPGDVEAQIAAPGDGEPCTPRLDENVSRRLSSRSQPSLCSASVSALSRRSHSVLSFRHPKGAADEDALERSLALASTGDRGEPDGQDLLGQSTDSFYFRVTAQLCSPCTYFGRRMAFNTLVCFLALTLQVMALSGTWYMYILYGKYGDGSDEETLQSFPGGVPRPANISRMLPKNGSFFFYPPLIVLCVIGIFAEMRGELAEAHIGYILMRYRWSDFLKGEQHFLGRTSHGREHTARGRRWILGLRLFCASNIQIFRLAVVLYFIDSAIFLLGSSDGPLDLMLNSLALVFILNMDNYITYDLPEENLFRLASANTLRKQADLWACTRSVFDRALEVAMKRSPRAFHLYKLVATTSRLTIGVLAIWMSLKLQRKTMQAPGRVDLRGEGPASTRVETPLFSRAYLLPSTTIIGRTMIRVRTTTMIVSKGITMDILRWFTTCCFT
jgi:hypothetical protein